MKKELYEILNNISSTLIDELTIDFKDEINLDPIQENDWEFDNKGKLYTAYFFEYYVSDVDVIANELKKEAEIIYNDVFQTLNLNMTFITKIKSDNNYSGVELIFYTQAIE